ncbi:MAG: mechanosensitive ion channel [Candidatus Micrarchaeaceae archaeon]
MIGAVAGALFYFYINTAHPEILPSLEYVNFAVAAILGIITIELLSSSIIEYGRYRHIEGDTTAVRGLFRLFAYAVLVIILLSILHINVTGLLIGAGFLGIVVGLAAQATLSNVFGGFTIISAKPFNVGDRITVSTWQYGLLPPSYPHGIIKVGTTGVVESIGLMYTKLIEEDGTPVFIPNGVLNSALIYNHRRAKGRVVAFSIELDNSTGFADFEKSFKKELFRNIGTRGLLKGIGIEIAYVGSTMYGVEISVLADEKRAEHIGSMLKKAALRASERLRRQRQTK